MAGLGRQAAIAASAALASMWMATVAMAAPPADIDARVAQLMSDLGVPGAAIAIVEDGRVTLERGYGVRRLGDPERVDARTLFQIGSVTKGMTAAALAVLVDRGALDWDDRVIEHLPEFQMHDPWVTREMTVRDLLAHRSGLGPGAGDLLFLPRTTFSRQDIVARLRHIRPKTSFRSEYAYSNVLYIVVGALIERVTGQTWEAFVHESLLAPSGMRTATTGNSERFLNSNRAHPHARTNGPVRGVGRQEALDEAKVAFAENMAPAGAVSASAQDMARWLIVQLAGGVAADGTRVFSERAGRDMWTPHVLMPIARLPDPLADATPQFSAYALGWDVRDYRGHLAVLHSGAVLGSESYVVMVPEAGLGIAIMMNSEDTVLLRGLALALLDHYLGLPARNWAADLRSLQLMRQKGALAAVTEAAKAPAAAGPSLPLQRYAGVYDDAWYGRMRIDRIGDALRMDFLHSPGMAGALTHYQYDTFRIDWDDRAIEPAYVTFGVDSDGKVERIAMRAVSPLADFSYDYHDLEFRPARQE